MNRILIVSCDEEGTRPLKGTFVRRGCIVERARDGTEALQKARSDPPEAIVLDEATAALGDYAMLRGWRVEASNLGIPLVIVGAPIGANAANLADLLAPICRGGSSDSEAAMRELEEKVAELEGQLGASRAWMAATLRAAGLGVWELKPGTLASTWSAEMYSLFQREPALGPPSQEEFLEWMHPEDREPFSQMLAASHTGEELHRADFRISSADGRERHFEAVTASPIVQNAGEIVGASVVLRDSTERHRTEERVRRLIDSNMQGIFFWRLDGTVTGANDAFLRMIGYTRQDLEDGLLDYNQLTPLEHRAADERPLKQILATGVCDPYEKEYMRKDGSQVPVLLGGATYADNPEEGVSFVVELTEQKKLEQQFLRTQRMESIGILAGGIAHDLNNVLSPILTSLELLQMRFTDRDSQELLAILRSSAHRGAHMVRQVLSFARGVEGQRVEVQVQHLVRDIATVAAETFCKNIQIRTSVPSDAWLVLGDATQIHQVLLNLCVNARDAMPQGGLITISVENLMLDEQYAAMNGDAKPGPYLVLKVEDNGSGISPENIEKIFDPFFTTKEVGMGTGLGLSTSMGIVKSHGGFLRVYSEVGKGTQFKAFFPALEGRVATAEPDGVVQLARGNGQCILLADDDHGVRQITRQTLEAYGFQVVLASNGAEAVATYARRRAEIALVITDMMMPVMDGTAVIQALRKLTPGLPIIAASGLSVGSRLGQLSDLGVKQLLSKPYTAESLLTAIAEALPK